MPWDTYGKLKAHRESVQLRVSTAGIILFKNCAIGDYSPIACKLLQRLEDVGIFVSMFFETNVFFILFALMLFGNSPFVGIQFKAFCLQF